MKTAKVLAFAVFLFLEVVGLNGYISEQIGARRGSQS